MAEGAARGWHGHSLGPVNGGIKGQVQEMKGGGVCRTARLMAAAAQDVACRRAVQVGRGWKYVIARGSGCVGAGRLSQRITGATVAKLSINRLGLCPGWRLDCGPRQLAGEQRRVRRMGRKRGQERMKSRKWAIKGEERMCE